MLKNLFAKKSQPQLSLFLGASHLAVCRLENDGIKLLAERKVSSESMWQETFASVIADLELLDGIVSVVLTREFYQTFDIEKPKVADNELQANLPFAIKDLVSESIFDLIVDYYDIPFQHNKGEQITAVCIAKTRVLNIRDMILNAGLKFKELTIEELALSRLLGESDDTNILLSQQKNELVLTVVKQGQLYFSHRLRGFNELLAQPLTDVEDELVGGLSLELQRVLDYIGSQFRIATISHLYLALVSPELELLAEKMSTYLDRNVLPYAPDKKYDVNFLLAYALLKEDEL